MRPLLATLPPVEDEDERRAVVAVVDKKTRELTVLSGEDIYPRAVVLVRDGLRTVDLVELDGPHDLVTRAVAASRPTPTRAWRDGAGAAVSATVILCTVGTNPVLPLAVQSLLDQSHQHLDIVVVDNAPDSGRTRQALAAFDDPRISIVDEPRRGLSHARNRGLRAARGDIVAFTDDDAIIHREWLASLLDVFGSTPAGSVGAVTGPAYAAELRSTAQRFFESRGGFPTGLDPVVWSIGTPSQECADFGQRGDGGPLFPTATARVGAGVSMAFSAQALTALGEFDTTLGAGTLTKGGEDLDAFSAVLRAGLAIVYNPDAVVHHVHRRDLAGLNNQIHGHGTGMAALLTKAVTRRPREAFQLIRRIPAILSRVAPGTERMRGREDDVPASLSTQEIRGFLAGPQLYLRQLWVDRSRP